MVVVYLNCKCKIRLNECTKFSIARLLSRNRFNLLVMHSTEITFSWCFDILDQITSNTLVICWVLFFFIFGSLCDDDGNIIHSFIILPVKLIGFFVLFFCNFFCRCYYVEVIFFHWNFLLFYYFCNINLCHVLNSQEWSSFAKTTIHI